MTQHHRTRPDLTYGIRNSLPGDVRRRSMHRLEHRRKFTFRIQIGRRSNPDRTHDRGSQIGKYVAKQIRTDNDIEPIRMANEVRGENIDVILVGSHVGIFRGELLEALIPERHSENDAVRLGRRRKVLLALAGQFKRVTKHTSDATAREHGLLDHGFFRGPLIDAPADVRVFSLHVFPDDLETDVAGFPVFQWGFNALEQPDRAEIYILLKAAANRDQQTPQREVIGNVRMADRAEKDGIEGAQMLDSI